jgi:hypothetical protein
MENKENQSLMPRPSRARRIASKAWRVFLLWAIANAEVYFLVWWPQHVSDHRSIMAPLVYLNSIILAVYAFVWLVLSLTADSSSGRQRQ